MKQIAHATPLDFTIAPAPSPKGHGGFLFFLRMCDNVCRGGTAWATMDWF